jgi:hypothetical protein
VRADKETRNSKLGFLWECDFQQRPCQHLETTQENKLNHNHDENILDIGFTVFRKGFTKHGIHNKDKCVLLCRFKMLFVGLGRVHDGLGRLLQDLPHHHGYHDA